MSQIIGQSLQKIAKVTTIVFLSTIIGMLFAFGSRLLVVRFFSQSEYGIYSLALTVFNIAVVIATLGFAQGSTRQIAHFRGKSYTETVNRVIFSSLQLPLIASIPISVTLFFASGIISAQIFHEPGLALPLKIFAIAIPFYVLIDVLTSIFRGFNEVRPKAYFQDILRNGLFPLLLVPFILLGLSFPAAMCSFTASIIITGVAFTVYTLRKALFIVKRYPACNQVGKELLLLSLPLLGTTMCLFLLDYTDTLMLGYFQTTEAVALYNSAIPLVKLVALPLTSMGFIYVPIASQLYSRNIMADLGRIYQVSTKWIFFVAFPIFLLLFIFPGPILGFFFGSQYTEASTALRILSLGIMCNTFFGANGMTLLAMGKTSLVMWANILAAGLNVVLNIIFIPLWSITGAAIASLISYLVLNAFQSLQLYHLSKIQPFTWNYLKPILSCGGIIAIIYLLAGSLVVVSFWMLPVIFLLFLVLYGLCIVLTRSFDKEDISMLSTIEKSTGINTEFLKRILARFL